MGEFQQKALDQKQGLRLNNKSETNFQEQYAAKTFDTLNQS